MIVKKITIGFVIQEYDTELKKWVGQEFVAGDEVNCEDEDGNPVADDEKLYLPFDMIQPEEN